MQLWTSVATLVTAVAALLTILEMRWQRHSGYLPDLVVAGEAFRMRGTALGVLELVAEAANGSEGPRTRPQVAIRCANVGIAHAKSLQIEWEYDLLEFVASIAELDSEVGSSIVFEAPLLHFDGSSRRSVHMVKTQATASLPSMAPGPMTGATRLSVPPAYMELLCVYCGGIVETLKRSRTGTEATPTELQLTVRYRDIGNNQHVRRFRVLPKFASIRTGLSGGGGLQELAEVDGYFEIQEA